LKSQQDFYSDYCNSIFNPSGEFAPSDYENISKLYDSIYGRLLPVNKHAPILDIGCGSGHFLYYAGKKGFTNFFGIDLSPPQIDFCRKHISPRCEKADVFDYLTGKENSFDCIVANDLIEHIPKAQVVKLLRLIYDALKPGGCFLSKTPNMGNPFSLYPRYRDFTHEFGLTDISFRQVLRISGFVSAEVTGLAGKRHFPESILVHSITFIMKKLFQLQGYNAPEILSPLLVGIAKK
jgi:SAM-dependent methyltransferase